MLSGGLHKEATVYVIGTFVSCSIHPGTWRLC